ncbi:MAG: glutamate-cysteine ligase family protein [Slackia sp.]|nr:glutamate-cysteine ligase family protein [Slackia sp.]
MNASENPRSMRGARNAQPARAFNKAALVSYFQEGAVADPREVGIELEHFLVDGTGEALSYSQPHGVRDVLIALSERYTDVTTHGNDILGVAKPQMNVTIEPAAQLELSAGPFSSLDTAKRIFDEFEADVARALEPVCGRAMAVGYDPSGRATDKELIPKARYDYMNEYLSAISPWGPRMMRGSASTQVSIDYRDEADCIAKMRIAAVLSPVFALICDNAAIFEGGPRPHPCMRTEVWKYCDPDRCNTPPHLMEPGFGFGSYADYILDTPAIVRMDENGEAHYDPRSFGDIFAEQPMTRADVEHALSMVFPDVRLKSYVEIRPADSMPVAFALSYAALIKGLFYYDECLEALRYSCERMSIDAIWRAKESVMAKGYCGLVYGRNVAEIADELFEMARIGLPAIAPHEKDFLEPLATLVAKRTTLADLS